MVRARPGISRRFAVAATLMAGVRAFAAEPPPPPGSGPGEAAPSPPAPAAVPGPAAVAEKTVESPTPEQRFVINNLLIFRYNPLGLEDQMRVGYQRKLLHRPGVLFRDTFVFLGLYPKLNPAYLKFGPSVELQALSILNLRVGAELIDYFSTFGYLQSYATPSADYSDTARDAADKINGAAYSTIGAHVMIEPTIQVKLGPIALRDKFAAEFWRMNLHRGDTVFYDATLDTLVPGNGWVIQNDLDALFVSKFGLTAGVRYTAVKPFYKAGDYRVVDGMGQVLPACVPNGPMPCQDESLNSNGHQRLGAVIAYTFFDHGYTKFNKPSLLVICSWYLNHHYRTGQDQSQAIPYFLLGLAFQSDLLR